MLKHLNEWNQINHNMQLVMKTSEERLIEHIWVRSSPLRDFYRRSGGKQTSKWIYFKRMAQKGQRKMIIYLTSRTVIHK